MPQLEDARRLCAFKVINTSSCVISASSALCVLISLLCSLLYSLCGDMSVSRELAAVNRVSHRKLISGISWRKVSLSSQRYVIMIVDGLSLDCWTKQGICHFRKS